MGLRRIIYSAGPQWAVYGTVHQWLIYGTELGLVCTHMCVYGSGLELGLVGDDDDRDDSCNTTHEMTIMTSPQHDQDITSQRLGWQHMPDCCLYRPAECAEGWADLCGL